MRKLAVVIAALAATAAFAPAADAAGLTVRLGDNFFKPSKKTIVSGTKVTWKWTTSTDHNVTLVTAPKGVKKSRYTSKTQNNTGDPFVRTLKVTGKYFFICTLHAGMEQTIKVTAS